MEFEDMGIAAIVILFVVLLIFALIGFVAVVEDTQITSNVLIKPEVTITIKNGIADTSYLYKE